jgi:hypothetical protein
LLALLSESFGEVIFLPDSGVDELARMGECRGRHANPSGGTALFYGFYVFGPEGCAPARVSFLTEELRRRPWEEPLAEVNERKRFFAREVHRHHGSAPIRGAPLGPQMNWLTEMHAFALLRQIVKDVSPDLRIPNGISPSRNGEGMGEGRAADWDGG